MCCCLGQGGTSLAVVNQTDMIWVDILQKLHPQSLFTTLWHTISRLSRQAVAMDLFPAPRETRSQPQPCIIALQHTALMQAQLTRSQRPDAERLKQAPSSVAFSCPHVAIEFTTSSPSARVGVATTTQGHVHDYAMHALSAMTCKEAAAMATYAKKARRNHKGCGCSWFQERY